MKTKPKLHPRAAKLLRLVRACLQKDMCPYNQNQPGIKPHQEKPDCGTPACIIGWLVFYATRHWSKAKRLNASYDYVWASTGLTQDQFTRLYLCNEWPAPFYHRLFDGDNITSAEAAKRITVFLNSDGEK